MAYAIRDSKNICFELILSEYGQICNNFNARKKKEKKVQHYALTLPQRNGLE